jgi:beta-galactosidase
MLMETVPGVFADMAGVEVEEYDPQFRKETTVSGVFGEGTAKIWCDVIKPVTAEALGVYTKDYYAGQPCMTANIFGKGNVYYLGCDLDDASMGRFMKYIAAKAGIPVGLYSIKGLEIVEATDGKKSAAFMLNHNSYPLVAPLEGEYTDLLTDHKVRGTITIEPYGAAILTR